MPMPKRKPVVIPATLNDLERVRNAIIHELREVEAHMGQRCDQLEQRIESVKAEILEAIRHR